jgi:hypothetical protein
MTENMEAVKATANRIPACQGNDVVFFRFPPFAVPVVPVAFNAFRF